MKIKSFLIIFALGGILFMFGCATMLEKDYTNFRIEDPKSILIVPVVNRSVEVNAPDYFLSTCSLSIAERGYYVFPVNMVKHLLEDDGLSDANLVHSADSTRLGELFGTDSILYISIERWDAQYAIFTTTVTVEFKYVLKSGKTGEILWEANEKIIYEPQKQNSSGNPLADLIGQAIAAAITKAAPNYIPLAQQANQNAVNKLHSGLPAGPYKEDYKKDMEQF